MSPTKKGPRKSARQLLVVMRIGKIIYRSNWPQMKNERVEVAVKKQVRQ
jgi:hypothetical protein